VIDFMLFPAIDFINEQDLAWLSLKIGLTSTSKKPFF
jgi:hypothetical protein